MEVCGTIDVQFWSSRFSAWVLLRYFLNLSCLTSYIKMKQVCFACLNFAVRATFAFDDLFHLSWDLLIIIYIKFKNHIILFIIIAFALIAFLNTAATAVILRPRTMFHFLDICEANQHWLNSSLFYLVILLLFRYLLKLKVKVICVLLYGVFKLLSWK